MKKIILYVTGGLSNRVFPICSCLEYARLTNRELLVYWPTDHRCLGKFNDLYTDKIKFVDEEFLKSLDNNVTEYHSKFLDGVHNDFSIYGRTFLVDKFKEGVMKIGETINLDKEIENVFLITNTFMESISEDVNKKILKGLSIQDDLKIRINFLTEKLNLSKEIIGVHIRGTDFNNRNNHYYISNIKKILQENPQQKFFVCSDDSQMEEEMVNSFPEKIITRSKIFLTKKNESSSWHNNTFTTVDSLKDSVIDLYLMAKTDFRFYNEYSTFSQYIKILSE